MPHRQITINTFVISGTTTMNGTKTFYSCIIKTLKRTNPKLKIGINRVLYQNRNIYALKRIRYFLHGKGIGRSTSTYPKNIYAGFQSSFHMCFICYLRSHKHSAFFLHALHPWKSFLAYSFKTSRFGTRFPYSRTKYFYSYFT